MTYRTINLPFVASGEVARKLLFTAWMYRCAVTTGFEKIRNLNYYPKKSEVFEKCYDTCKMFLKISYYVNQACNDIYEIVTSCKELKVKLDDVEFKNWLYIESQSFRQNGKLYSAIKLVDEKTVEAKLLINYDDYDTFTIVTHGAKSRRFMYMLLDAINEQDYHCRIYINGWSRYNIGGVVQVSVPERIWLKYELRDSEAIRLEEVEYVLGFDVNFDRINWVLIDLDERIVNLGTIWFEWVVTQGACAKGMRGYVIQELHKLFTRLKILERKKLIVAVEKSQVLQYLKLIWIRSGERKNNHYNYKVSRFRAKTIEDIEQIAKLYAVPIIEVDPKGTTHSREHDEVMIKLGLDRHMASAYIIAKRALAQLKQGENM